MSSALARPLLHLVHLVTFVVLLVTGVLLLVPGLRAMTTGGYSLLILQGHCWVGVAFVALPAAIVLRYGVRSLAPPPGPPTVRGRWQSVHLAVTVAVSAAFAGTGFALWGDEVLPERFVDGSFVVHDWLTYGAVVLLGAHLLEVGMASVVARFGAAAGGGWS